MKTKSIAIILIILLSVAAIAQDNRPARQDRFKRIQAHWGWYVINALDLDMESEKGKMVMDVLNKKSRAEHEYYYLSWKKKEALFDLMKAPNYNIGEVEKALLDIESFKNTFRQNDAAFHESIKKLLTPLERAKLMAAEDNFRQKVRSAVRGNRRGGANRGGGNKPPGQ